MKLAIPFKTLQGTILMAYNSNRSNRLTKNDVFGVSRILAAPGMTRACGFLVTAIGVLVLVGCQRPGNEVQQATTDRATEAPASAQVSKSESPHPRPSREAYDTIVENEFLDSMHAPQSTFSIDVDTASYSNVRRLLNDGRMPPRGAVRIEELVNYFDYDYSMPTDQRPFSVGLDMATCPWQPHHQLLRVALNSRTIEPTKRPACNLVFLLDVSGSMKQANKLPLVKSAMRLLVEQLDGNDRVAIAVYAGASDVALRSTSINKKNEILNAISNLSASGATNGAAGIELAYELAQDNFIQGGTNRVILCSDGDFNVGTTSQSGLVDLITEKAKSNIFLSVFGFGIGDYQDSTMEKLADMGNGNYGYIDTMLEAHKTFVRQLGANLVTIAKDVKIQIDFNPAHIAAYRLIGYENRKLETKDFADDKKDAGEIGAGHAVTALYEIVPASAEPSVKAAAVRHSADSEFVKPVVTGDVNDTAMVVAIRYKAPEADVSQEFKVRLDQPTVEEFSQTNADFKFASSVAAFGMLLRASEFVGTANIDWVIATAQASVGDDPDGFRNEFVQLAKKSRLLMNREYSSK